MEAYTIKEIAISWVLYSIRETMGLEKVRNEILAKKLKNHSIKYGKMFTKGNTFEDIYQMVYDFQKSNENLLIFTSNGEITKKRKRNINEDIESHYISFIVDKQKMNVTMIDPSRNNESFGIYNPYIGISMKPFFEKLGYKVDWLKMTSPCQINYHDVFCQSWTLYLLIKFFKSSEKIYIPFKEEDKYNKLLIFYKKLLKYEIFRKELNISYIKNINVHENYDELCKFDPCNLLNKMIVSDVMN